MSTASFALRRNQNLVRSSARLNAGPLTVSFMLITLVILLALLYLNQVAKTSTFNYRISSLNGKVNDLSSQKEKLEVDAARLQSINSLKDSDSVKQLVPVDNVTYAHTN